MITERQRIAVIRRSLQTRRRVWAYITEHPRASLAEISRALGYDKPNGAIVSALDALRDAGYIAFYDGQARARTILIPFVVTMRKR